MFDDISEFAMKRNSVCVKDAGFPFQKPRVIVHTEANLLAVMSYRRCLVAILCLKNDIGVARYNFNAHQPISVIFGRDVAERVCCQIVICYPTSHN